MKLYDVALFGAGKVGKSALLHYLREGKFLTEYNPTVQENYNHILTFEDGQTILVNILDTAGFYQFPAMREVNIRSSETFIVVFALDDLDSFEQAISIKKLIDSIKEEKKPTVLLVGNKNEATNKRVIPSEVILQAAEEHFKGKYIETSTKDGSNVLKAFQTVCFSLTSGHIRPRTGSDPNKMLKYLRQKLTKKKSRKTSLELIPDDSPQAAHNIYENILRRSNDQDATCKKSLVKMSSFAYGCQKDLEQFGLKTKIEDTFKTEVPQVIEENIIEEKPKRENVFAKFVRRMSQQRLLRASSFT